MKPPFHSSWLTSRIALRLRLHLSSVVACAALLAVHAHGGVFINEFMALNDGVVTDEDGRSSDWVELYNSGTTAVDLTGWYLTDNAGNLTKWAFPATNIAPAGFVLVFASDDDRAVPGQELHADFKLSGDGEYLGLVAADGVTVVSEYAPSYPPQVPDVSYGIYSGADETMLVPTGAVCRALVPDSGSLGTTWLAPAFSDAGWQAGHTAVGYDTSTAGDSYDQFIGLDLESAMHNSRYGCYIRIPFVVSNAAQYGSLLFRMMYDDGYVAYLNGTEIARGNAPASPQWDSPASAGHSDSLAVIFEDTLVPDASALQDGLNVVAIHGMNATQTSSDLLMLPELRARTGGQPRTNDFRFFPLPTPGAPNGYGVAILGPLVKSVAHYPLEPTSAQPLTVTARVTAAQAPVNAVTCVYRVMYGSEVALPMYDDGVHGDGSAGDNVYGAAIPAASGQPGELLRYYITASDVSGNVSRLPLFLTDTSEEYFGTVVQDPSLSTNVPVCHWFVDPAHVSAAHQFQGTRCTLYYHGELYDNIYCRLRGGSSASQAKKSHKFEFNSDHNCKIAPDMGRVDEINLNSMYNDQSYLREYLAWKTLDAAGVPGSVSFHINLQLNAEFYGLVLYVEQVDGDFLRREGIDDRGRLFKAGMNQLWLREPTLTNTSNGSYYELKRPRDGNFDDLRELITTLITSASDPRWRYIYDYINIPEVVNYLGAHLLIQDMDWGHKNYFMYRDTFGTREWTIFGWDKDLTFGHRWNGTVVEATNDGTGRDLSSPFNGFYNVLYGTFYNNTSPWPNTPELQQMYARRARTLMDKLLKAPGTAYPQLWYEQEISRMSAMLKPLADADRTKWGWPTPGGYFNYAHLWFDEGVHELTNEYFRPRRTHLYVTHNVNSGGIIPNSQPGSLTPDFGDIVVTPAAGDPDGEYVELQNNSDYAVDISGWYLTNAIRYTFKPGVVIPAHKSLYVSPDVNAFRARPTSPTGNEVRFVQGNYKGRLSTWGGTIELFDADQNLQNSVDLPSNPSDLQRYLRVSELMYHPPDPPAASPYADDDFEFVEFVNIGTGTLDLYGVQFDNGVQAYISNHLYLAQFECAVLVRNPAAFGTRYSTNGIRIAGTYAGAFDNSGESVAYLDRQAEDVLDFTYDDLWYPLTDGNGSSLEVVDPTTPRTMWSAKETWRASALPYGTPGVFVPEPAWLLSISLAAMMYGARRRN